MEAVARPTAEMVQRALQVRALPFTPAPMPPAPPMPPTPPMPMPAELEPPQSGLLDPWECAVCTLLNPEAAALCEVCESPRPLAPDQWTCGACTFVNMALPTCEMCGAARPAESPVQERQPLAPRQGAVAGQKTKKPAGKGSKPKKERKDHAAGMEPLEMYNFSPRAIRRIRMPENCVSFLFSRF